MRDKEFEVFISYSRKDTPTVNRICKALDYQGITYFIDQQRISGGMEFPERIAEAIMGCRIVLFVASENSYQSKFTSNEVVFAFNKKPASSVIPYIIDNSSLPQEFAFMFINSEICKLGKEPIETAFMEILCKALDKKYLEPEQVITKECESHRKRKQDEISGFSCVMLSLIPIIGLALAVWLGIYAQSVMLAVSIVISTVFLWIAYMILLDSETRTRIGFALKFLLVAVGCSAFAISTWVGLYHDSFMIGCDVFVVIETIVIVLSLIRSHFNIR